MQTNNESKQNQKKADDAWNFVCNCYDHYSGDTNEKKDRNKDE